MDKQTILKAICDRPWLLKREALERKLAEVKAWPQGISLESVDGTAAQTPEAETQGTVAVIPIRGIITHRGLGGFMAFFFGGTSIESIRRSFRRAMADPAINAVVFDIDSPGGDVVGVPELAAEILATRGPKPIKAVSTGEMESAAYWIGSAADEVIVSPSASAGSIGVWAMHVDESGALEQAGLDVTLISAGKFKVEGNPFEALGDEARAFVQGQVDSTFADFVKAVAKGRKVTAAAVRNGFGQGRSLLAQAAVEAGLADRVATLEETLQGLTAGARRRRRADAVAYGVTEAEIARYVESKHARAHMRRPGDCKHQQWESPYGYPERDKEAATMTLYQQCDGCGLERVVEGYGPPMKTAMDTAIKTAQLSAECAALLVKRQELIDAGVSPDALLVPDDLAEKVIQHIKATRKLPGAFGDALARAQAHRMRYGRVDNPEA